MTIRPGSAYGQRIDRPADAIDVASDSALAAAIATNAPRPIVVRGGDLFRTLGAPQVSDSAEPGGQVTRVPVDVMTVTTESATVLGIAHVVCRAGGRLGWWRGRIVAVMNAEYLGAWDVAPRAHPGDGRLDIVVVAPTMTVRARWQAWRRLPNGAHVPHPDISTRRAASVELSFDHAVTVAVDGQDVASSRTVRVELAADRAVLHV